jgi:DNA-binding phage protein
MVEKKINAEELAKRIGMDRATFYRRLSKSDDFTIKEVDSIVRELCLTMDETIAIFFAGFVA